MSKVAITGNASGTGTLTIAAPNTNSDYTLTLPQGTGTVVANNVNSAIVSGTAQASTSGTSIDFTGIPSWVKRITVMFSGVSTNGSSIPIVQLGDSGGVETTGYTAVSGYTGAGTGVNTYTTGFGNSSAAAVNLFSGSLSLFLVNTSNVWVASGIITIPTYVIMMSGTKTLSDTLDRIRITTVNGTDTFDAGTINILYE